MTDFTDDVAVVTGGTKGIGRAVVEQLAAGGATTVATYANDEAAARETEAELQKYDPDCAVRQFDVAEYDAVAEAFEAVSDEFGRPSILVNNAGVMVNSLLVRMDPDEWREVVETNLTGAFNCTRVAARMMLRERRGRVVNVSSVAAQRGWPGQANYAASKAGLVGFTRSIARELGGKDIRVNAVCPGYTETELYAENIEDADLDLVDAIPRGEVATPEEIADTVTFLLSESAANVNGAVLRVDGGMLA